MWPSTTIRAWDLDAVQTPRWNLCTHELRMGFDQNA
jgi:hypothetical protein